MLGAVLDKPVVKLLLLALTIAIAAHAAQVILDILAYFRFTKDCTLSSGQCAVYWKHGFPSSN